ncbi:MAG: hypothetical protein JNM57_12765 [Cyclobacteriaceae bacterium]|nr:hypothetical protein [Cyclobacteriaceae bacterium]
MNLNSLDISIIVTYLLITVVIGFIVKKQAFKNIKNYFLGGNTLANGEPLWMYSNDWRKFKLFN